MGIIYIMNRIGPRTYPWGTSWGWVNWGEFELLILIEYELFETNDISQLWTWPWIPIELSLILRIAW